MAYLSVPVGGSLHVQYTCKAGCKAADLTGWTTSATVYAADGTTRRTLSPTISTPSAGLVDLVISPTDTTAIGKGTWSYDVWVTSGDGSEADRIQYDTLDVV